MKTAKLSSIGAGILFIGVLLTLGLIGFYQVRADNLRNEALAAQKDRAQVVADGIETYLISAEQLANTTASLVAPQREDKTAVENLLLAVLASAPRETIYGIGAWYEPGVFLAEEQYFGPYVHQGAAAEDDAVLTYEWTTPEYNFHEQPWYVAGKAGAGTVIFTEPYFDTDLVYMSATKAFTDADGAFTGVITVDMVLPLLAEYINQANDNANETIFVTTASGAIFVHPDEADILKVAQERGKSPTSILDLNSADLAAYRDARDFPSREDASIPVDYAGWTVHVSTDRDYLFREVTDLRNTVFAIGAGLWALLLVAVPVINQNVLHTQVARQEQRRLEIELQERKRMEETLQKVNEELEARVQQRTAELQKAKEEAEEANRVKSRFLANMSHELRTPLNAILNFTEFMIEGFWGPVTTEQIDALSKVVSSGDHLLSLINDILDITKIEVGMMEIFHEDVDINIELRSVLSTGKVLIKDKPFEFIEDIHPNLPLITGDRRRIHQVFLNLLSNAAKFTKAGSITISAQPEGEHVHISVKDTGVGISPEDQKVVFESFKQAEHGLKEISGTGLGLPISKHFVEAHGGRLWVESEVGKGSTFHVMLPVKVSETVGA